ncbi:MAG: flagellar biosynthesis anti-sigma factor FlgM [Desulfobaccales bacterium]
MSNDEKHHPGCQSDSTSSGKTPEGGEDSLEGLKRLALEVVYQTPKVRPEKVARLKEAIDQGTYEIDSAKLAEIITEELLGKR